MIQISICSILITCIFLLPLISGLIISIVNIAKKKNDQNRF